MGLSSILGRALGGLATAQAAVGLVSQNIANAGTPGYTRKVAGPVELGAPGGVMPGEPTRQLDAAVQRQLRLERAGGVYADTMSSYLGQVDGLFGQPGSADALDTLFNGLTQAAQSLATSPDDPTARSAVLQAGQALTSRLNGLSDDIQNLRQAADTGLADAVGQANDALSRLQKLNAQVVARNGTASMSPDLLDARDQAIDDLSKLVDIRVNERSDGGVTVSTQSGVVLFDGTAARLEFDGGNAVNAQTLYDPDPAKRNLGTITLVSGNGSKVDLLATRAFQSGRIGALVDLRDRALVDTQNQLDTLADGLAKGLSGRDVAGTAASGPAPAGSGFDLDVSSLQKGDVVHLTYTQAGVTRNISVVRVDDPTLLPLPNSATPDPNDVVIGVDFSGGASAAATAIQNALGSKFGAALTVSATGSTLQVRDDGTSTASVGALSATETNTGLTGSATDLSLSFFSDGQTNGPYTGDFEGVSQKLGFAGRIAVNPALVADPTKLTLYSASTLAGDASRPNEILRRLTQASGPYPLDGAAQPFTGTLGALTQTIIDRESSRAAAAQRMSDGQKIVVDSLQQRADSVSGVNIDQEMSDLVTLQNAYAANARVMTVVQQMMTDLMNATTAR